MHRASIVIVTPALADANNGNWQTARRWARLLGAAYRVRIVPRWDGGDEALMIALHARRSAASVAAWRAASPARPLVVVMTGTDLYADLAHDAQAQHAVEVADRLVVLNELGARALPAAARAKAMVVLQSCSARATVAKPRRHLRALAVGHLRAVKDPGTLFAAVRRLDHRPDLRVDHVGDALEPALGAEATALTAHTPQYRWLGGRPHAEVRRRIQAAHVLVHPSRLEGGAHVVIEAVRSGTPVLASRIDGNLGLLGEGYGGYFPPGDAVALAGLLERARDDADMLPALQRQLAVRAPRFAPEAESATLHRLVAELLESPAGARR